MLDFKANQSCELTMREPTRAIAYYSTRPLFSSKAARKRLIDSALSVSSSAMTHTVVVSERRTLKCLQATNPNIAANAEVLLARWEERVGYFRSCLGRRGSGFGGLLGSHGKISHNLG